MICMLKNTACKYTLYSQNEILRRLVWFRNMSEFYRRSMDYAEFGEHEINTFEIEKDTFLKSHNLENIY